MRKERFAKLEIPEYIRLKNQIVALIMTNEQLRQETTFPQIRKKFDLTYDQIEEICGCVDNITINVGIGTEMGGYAELPKKEWTVEILG